jgi:energy-coupling factor transporter ATP-binding protein EcfA2
MFASLGGPVPYTPAYFTSLTLKDVRCFGGEHTVDLRAPDGRPAKWTIILGENGVGKTTLLQCLDRMSPFAWDKLLPGATVGTTAKQGPIGNLHELVRVGAKNCVVRCEVVVGQSLAEIAGATAGDSLELSLAVGETVRSSQFGELSIRMHCCGYGAARRPGVAKLAQADRSDPAATLYDDTATLVDVEEWLLQLDYAARANQALRGRFERVKQLLIDLLPDIADLRIVGLERNPPAPAVEMHSPFGWIRPKQTSLGYQAMMAWIVDLANRMFTAFPDSPDPLHEPSVVLIDEIDLHLHPRWQRDLIGFLDAHFPNVQFIATAHSPLVVQAAQDANLVVIRRQGDSVEIDNDPQSVRGWRIDQILTSELFGLKSARPPQIEQLLSQRRALLSKRDLTDEDRAQLARLDIELGELPAGETAEDVEALETIRRFAAHLRDDRRTGT